MDFRWANKRQDRTFKKDPIVGFNDVLAIAEDGMRKLEESLGEATSN